MIIDDEESILQSLKGIFIDEGYNVFTALTGEEGLKVLEITPISLIFLDIWLPGIDGIELLQRIKKKYPLIAVIMISGHGTIETAVKATKMGAYYFIEKPIDLDKILLITGRAYETIKLERENILLKNNFHTKVEMIGKSSSIQSIKKQIMMSAPSNGRVLIYGENGTGKELVSRSIHNHSKRCKGPFVEVNCAAIPEDLIESELFGHEKGSFTGATNRKIGKFELANSGTIFLDEVGDMSLKTQAKVLRVLEESKIERVGGTETIPIDVRVIAASNKALEEEIKDGNFREDLFYRLNVIPIEVPPLRDRIEDIPLLCKYYIDLFCIENGIKKKVLAKEAQNLLTLYNWPGNIRELKNVIERLVIMIEKDKIGVEDIPPPYNNEALIKSNLFSKELLTNSSLREAKDSFERIFISKKLQENDWNIKKTAEALSMERSNLHRKMKLLGIKVSREE